MRVLLLLSALLAAFVGGGASASVPVARAQQVAMVTAIAVAATSIASSRRPLARVPGLAAQRAAQPPRFAALSAIAPLYAMRLRV